MSCVSKSVDVWLSKLQRATSVLALLACLATANHAQSTNGQISGIIEDASKAGVPDAEVVAVNAATGIEYRSTTNESGAYIIPELLPGRYKITVIKAGFTTVEKDGLTLQTSDRTTVNFNLTVASVGQNVTVQEDFVPFMVSTDQTSNSTTLDNKMITELPQLNRSTLQLTAVTPAVQGQGPLSDNIATLGTAGYLVGNHGTSYSVGGGQVNGTTISVDGNLVQDQEYNTPNRSIPTPDTISEFRVESGVLTADHGRYSGGIISMNTKSGTSAYHGRLFEYFRNQAMNANDWNQNASGVPIQAFHQNNYGASVGGPIWIPKIYSRKDKTFFFFGWEGERFSQSLLTKSSVPTALNLQGDFSQTIAGTQNGQPVNTKIFDPFNSYTDGSGNLIRPEFPGDKIPAAGNCVPVPAPAPPGGCFTTMSPLFQHYLSLFPAPNHAPDANSDHLNNYWQTVKTARPSDRFFLRIDHNLSATQRLSFSVSRSNLANTFPTPGGGLAESITRDTDWSGSALYTWVISPRSIIDVHLGVGHTLIYSDGVSGLGMVADPNIDTTTWGFDPLLINNPSRDTTHIPPGIQLPGYSSVGGSEFDTFINQTTNGAASFTHVMGRHTVKAGVEVYFARFDEHGGDHTGVAWLNPGGGSNQNWQSTDLTGNPLAELMMGSSKFFQWGNWNIAPYGWNQAAYVTDDWKVNNKLTLQLGLRWDHDGGRQSRYPKGSLMYDTQAKNVLTANSDWNWSQVASAVPGLGALAQPNWVTNGTQGRVVLLDTPEYPQKNLYKTDWRAFQPRVGIAYALTPKTVLRAGAGMVDQGLGGLSTDYFSFYYNSVTFNQISSLDGGQHYISNISNPFPVQPNGTALGYFPPVTTNAAYGFQTFGAASNLDQGGTTMDHYNNPMDYMWEASVQRQVSDHWVFTANYTGIHGVHLLMPVWAWSPNNIPLQYYSLGSHLQDQVPNPFYGQSQTFASEPTVPLYQLLGRSPQYTNLSPGQATWGRSFSNFLTLQMQSRAWHGLTFLGAYTIRKTLTNTGGKDIQHGSPTGNGLLQNPHDLMEGYGLALYELPQTLLLNYSYDLPFGRGRQFLNNANGFGQKVINGALGGWAFAGVSTWYPKGTPVLVPQVSGGTTAPGAALRWSLADTNYLGSTSYSRGLFVNGAFTNPNPAGIFNSSSFVRTPDYGLSNAAFVFPNVRNPGSFYTDATLLKKFYFAKSDAVNLEFRAEALNLFNHPNYGTIDNNPDSATFGGVQGKTGNRIMQLGLRLFF